MADLPEAKRTITMSWAMLAYVIMAVFMLTSVYWRFVVVEQENDAQDGRMEYINVRIDKKHKQQQDEIHDLETRIKTLEEPNSDD